MPLILPGNVASATAAAFEVANSCRFNDGDAPKMTLTPGSNGSAVKFTFSCWVKRGEFGAQQYIMLQGSGSTLTHIKFDANDKLDVQGYESGTAAFYNLSNRVFRDSGAWYNIIVAIDTTQGTAANRVKIYVNGTEETSWDTETVPDEDKELAINNTGYDIVIGAETSANYFDGYLAEVVYIDGTQYANTDFGEFDSDSPTIWKPKDPSGLTFGTNGFYLDFEASDNLGNDANGGTDFTETNLAAADQSTDSPTNNFATGNPLNWGTSWSGSLSNGNNTLAGSSSSNTYNTLFSTIAVNTGKWYAEFKITTSDMNFLLGVSTPEAAQLAAQTNKIPSSTYISTGHGYGLSLADGIVYFQNNGTTYGQTDISGDGSQNDIIGIYLDLDNNKLYFGLNGTVLASGVGEDITNDYYHFHAGDGSASAAAGGDMNFGANGAFGDTAVSSAVADANGYGAFEI